MKPTEIRAIADSHIRARRDGSFDDIPVKSPDELKQKLKEGKTFSTLLNYIETRYVSVTSLILAGAFNHETDAYKRGIYKGFKTLMYERTAKANHGA